MRSYRKPRHYQALTLAHRPYATQQAQMLGARVSDRRALKSELEHQVPKPTFGHRKAGTKGHRPVKAVSSGKGMTKAVQTAPQTAPSSSGGISREIKKLMRAPQRDPRTLQLPYSYQSRIYGYSKRYDA